MEMIYKKTIEYLCQNCGHEYKQTMKSTDKYIETVIPKCPKCDKTNIIIKNTSFSVDKNKDEQV